MNLVPITCPTQQMAGGSNAIERRMTHLGTRDWNLVVQDTPEARKRWSGAAMPLIETPTRSRCLWCDSPLTKIEAQPGAYFAVVVVACTGHGACNGTAAQVPDDLLVLRCMGCAAIWTNDEHNYPYP